MSSPRQEFGNMIWTESQFAENAFLERALPAPSAVPGSALEGGRCPQGWLLGSPSFQARGWSSDFFSLLDFGKWQPSAQTNPPLSV